MKLGVSCSLWWALLFVAQIPMLVVYLVGLGRDPIYGWLPLVVLLAAAALVAMRWDRIVEYPRKPLVLGAIGTGLLAAMASALTGIVWMAGVGGCFTAGGFLACHHARDRRSLFPIWYLTWAVLRIPGGGNDFLTQTLTVQLSRAVKNTLRLTDVPHLALSDSIEVVGARIYFAEASYSMLSWPLFVSFAMLYSALTKRQWLLAVLNYLSALFWCFAFHCGVLLTCVAWQVPVDSSRVVGIEIAWGCLVFFLFISAERGFLTWLQPISETSSDSRFINPFVVAWNWCFDIPRHRTSKSKSDKRWASRPIWVSVVIAISSITLIVEATQVPRAIAACKPPPVFRVDANKLQAQVFPAGQDVDYRHTYYEAPLIEGQEADVWSVYAPLVIADYIVVSRPRSPFDVAEVYRKHGWEIVEPQAAAGNLPNEGQLIFKSVLMNRGRRQSQLFAVWLKPDGSAITPEESSVRGHLIVGCAQLFPGCSATARRLTQAEFTRFVLEVQKQLFDSTHSELVLGGDSLRDQPSSEQRLD